MQQRDKLERLAEALTKRLVMQSGIALAHGEIIRRIDETYKKRKATPDRKEAPQQTVFGAEGGIVRGRWCITALRNQTTIPGGQSAWDAEFDKQTNATVFAAAPTCYGELPASFWHRWATRHVLLLQSDEAVTVDYVVAMTGASGDAVLKMNGKLTTLAPPFTSVQLEVRAGMNRLAIISKGNVELYGFGQLLGGPVRFADKGCGRFGGQEGPEGADSGPAYGEMSGGGTQ